MVWYGRGPIPRIRQYYQNPFEGIGMSTSKPLLIKLFLLFLGVSCSSLPRSDPAVKADFILEGRIGIRGMDRATSASVRWVQSENNFDVVFWGPLGQGKTRLVGSASSVTVETADAERVENIAPGKILQEQVGISAPIDAFSVWVRGRPITGAIVEGLERAETGDVIAFKQLGIDLAYRDFRLVDGYRVPHRISCTDGMVELTILVKRWQFAAAQQ